MAVFINGVIMSGMDREALGMGLSLEEASTSLVDVIGQVKAQHGEGLLKVYINSPGGEVNEGFAIHDYLTSLGRPIHTVAIEQCASVATVVFLAGDTRQAQCELMIHNPWTTAEGDAGVMASVQNSLSEAENRLEKFYAQKLSIDNQTISNLMQAITYISIDQALALGFTTQAVEAHPAMAMIRAEQPGKKEQQPINTNNKPINKKMTETIFKKALKVLGFAVKGELLCLELTAADGTTLIIEREDGEPQVGDAATPDGEFLMPNGATIVVVEGVITEIRQAEGTTEDNPIEEQLTMANARIAELEGQISSLRAQAVSTEERKAINAVNALGGIKALASICSTYKPAPRESAKAANTPHTPAYRHELNTIKNRKK